MATAAETETPEAEIANAASPNAHGEALLAVIGVAPLLEPGKMRVSADQRDRADRMPTILRREIRRFLAAADFDGEHDVEKFKYRRVLEAMTTPVPRDRLAEKLGAFEDPEDLAAFQVAAGRALAYAQSLFPRRTRSTAVGPVTIPPSDMEISRFRRRFDVVNDPLVAIRDMNEGILSTDQVKALEAVYPALTALMRTEVLQGLAAIVARRPNWQPPHGKVKQLQILMQAQTWDKALAKELQAAHESPEATQDPRAMAAAQDAVEGNGQPLQVDTSNTQTPIQRIAAR